MNSQKTPSKKRKTIIIGVIAIFIIAILIFVLKNHFEKVKAMKEFFLQLDELVQGPGELPNINLTEEEFYAKLDELVQGPGELPNINLTEEEFYAKLDELVQSPSESN